MAIEQIYPIYNVPEKHDGDTLPSSDWNELTQAVTETQQKTNEIIVGIDDLNSPLTVEQDSQDVNKTNIKITGILVGQLSKKTNEGTNVTFAGNNNLNIEPRPALGTGNGGNDPNDTNRKGGNIAIKPGDDIELYSHKRGTQKNTEVTVKILDGKEHPVKLQLHTADLTISTKGKALTRKKDNNGQDITTQDIDSSTGKDRNALYDDPDVLNININKDEESDNGYNKGYLKVHAQAIDLCSETHGGIALQPRGSDGDGYQNKIKFEHGGGDGLEFGTFNAEKTSIYTSEYRFKKDGIVKMSTRTVLDNTPGQGGNDKYNGSNIDSTTHYSYQKNTSDDFYDFFDSGDPTCTWEDIIKSAHALNGMEGLHTHITQNGDFEIESIARWQPSTSSDAATKVVSSDSHEGYLTMQNFFQTKSETGFTLSEFIDVFGDGILKANESDVVKIQELNGSTVVANESYACTPMYQMPKINIESDGNITISSKGKLKLGGELDFGSRLNFGETDKGIETLYKLTKKNGTKDCGILRIIGINNHESNPLTITNIVNPNTKTISDITIQPGQTQEIASCSILDIVNFVNYSKIMFPYPWQL